MATKSFLWDDGSGDHLYVSYDNNFGDQSISVTSDNNNGSTRVKSLDITAGNITRHIVVTQTAGSLAYYSINLNNEWILDNSIYNPNSLLYSGVYKSFSNYHVANSTATMTITLNGYSTFEIYIRSWAESTYDYTMASTLDGAAPTSSSSSTCYAHTKNSNNTSGTDLNDYKKVTYSNISTGGRDHTITIVYMKDQYTDSNDDRGYLLIPWYDNTKRTLTFIGTSPIDGSNSSQTMTYMYRDGDQIQLPGQIFSFGNYRITGWDDGDMLWLPEANYTVNGDATFQARLSIPSATELTSFSSMNTGDSIQVLLMNTNGSKYIGSDSNSTTVSTTTSQSTALGDSSYIWTLTKYSSSGYRLTNSAGYTLYSSQNSSLSFSTSNATSWNTSYSDSNKWYFRRSSNSSYYLRLNGTTLQSSSSSTGRYWRVYQITYN